MKRELQLQSIKRKKDSGILKNMVGVVPIIVVIMLAVFSLQFEISQAASAEIEDALVEANLASAVIDIQKYGASHQLLISSPQAACETFQRVLQANLSLDEQWECKNSSLIEGKVRLDEYSIYEVRGRDIIQYCFKQNTMSTQAFAEGVGRIEAPDGTKIQTTSVYSKISFQVRFFGRLIEVYKHKCVDVITN